MPTILLTHAGASREMYFGPDALDGLRSLGEVRTHRGPEPLAGDALVAAARGCDLIVADRATAVPAAILSALPDLAAIVRVAVDIRNIDVEAASRAGILVTHASAGFMTSVAELVIGYVIDLSRGISAARLAYRDGATPPIAMGRQLRGRVLGIVGYGAIGRELARLATALGLTVRACDPHVEDMPDGIEATDFRSLLAGSDVVVCLAAAGPSTENLFDAAAFAAMRPTAYFVNVSRGMLVDEDALLAALDGGRIAGAAMDVGRAPDEMPSAALALHPRVIATPHIGGLTPEAAFHQSAEAVRQCAELLAGRLPHGAVNAADADRWSRFGTDNPGERRG